MVQIHLGAPKYFGRIAQGLERLLDTQEVRGSIPRAPTSEFYKHFYFAHSQIGLAFTLA